MHFNLKLLPSTKLEEFNKFKNRTVQWKHDKKNETGGQKRDPVAQTLKQPDIATSALDKEKSHRQVCQDSLQSIGGFGQPLCFGLQSLERFFIFNHLLLQRRLPFLQVQELRLKQLQHVCHFVYLLIIVLPALRGQSKCCGSNWDIFLQLVILGNCSELGLSNNLRSNVMRRMVRIT